ncbi:MAG: phage tail tape measure protein [Euryarchaeota archaeon]|nr:phage tail tape measure protein [Euryarchaeota archaeon]
MNTSKKADNASVGFAKSLGGLAVGAVAVKALKAVVAQTVKFEKEMSNVKALLKPTASEFEMLSTQARELGKSTAFSAMQSAEAFAELGKLGFKTNEIMASSADVLNLAAAANTNMATSAEVTAKTLNQFNLSASEAGRVTDVIAKASSSSAIDIYNFKEAMKIAGGVASGFGVSLEQSTGAISALADAGLEGTMAGTGLSRILVEMAKSGSKASKLIKSLGVENGTLTEKLHALQKRGLTTSEIIDTFGQIAGKSAIALINNAEKVDTLAEAYKNASGAAKEMADVQLDNLDGSIKLLQSAASELALVLGDIFTPALRGGIDLTTKAVKNLTKYNIVSAVEGAKLARENRKTWDKSSESLDDVAEQLFKIQGLQSKIKPSKGLVDYNKKENDELNRQIKERVSIVNSWVESSAKLKLNEKGFYEMEGKGLSDILSLSSQLQIQEAESAKEKEDAAIKAIVDAEKKKAIDEKNAKMFKEAEALEKKQIAYDKLRSKAKLRLREITVSQMSAEEQAKQKILDGYKEILANETLTAEERTNINAIQKSEVDAVTDEFAQKQLIKEQALTTALLSEEERRKQETIKKWGELTESANATGEQKLEAERALRDELQIIDDEYRAIDEEKRLADEEKEKQALLKKIENAQMWKDAIGSIMGSVFQIKENNLRRETQSEIQAIRSSTKSQEEKAKAISKIEQKASKESLKIKLAEWRTNLLMSIANTALGVTKALASAPPPANFVMAGLTGAAGIASTAVIASNKPRLALGSVNAFGESSEIGNRSGINGVDSQLALVSPDEMIIKPKDVPLVKETLNNKTTNNNATTTNNNVFSPVVNVSAMSSEGVEDAVLSALYTAQENNKVDNTRLSIGA